MTDKQLLDWLQEKVEKSGYAISLQQGSNPPFQRFVLQTGVGSGPWGRKYEESSLRLVIEEAMKDEER